MANLVKAYIKTAAPRLGYAVGRAYQVTPKEKQRLAELGVLGKDPADEKKEDK